MTAELAPEYSVGALEAEGAVIGSILVDPRCLGAVARLLRPEDFALEINRALYETALCLDREGRAVDPVTLKEELLRQGLEVSNNYLWERMYVTPTATNAEEYAAIVREEALGRRLLSALDQGKTSLLEHTAPQEVLIQTVRALAELQQEGVTSDLVNPDEAVLAFYTHREQVESGTASGYIRTGYQDLDEQLGGGMLAGGMYVLAARPAMGKTTLAINIADRLAASGHSILFVSLEMDTDQLEAKRLARETGIPANRLLMAPLTEEEHVRVMEAADVIRTLPVQINRRENANVTQIETMARQVPGLRLIVIDYLGKVLPEDRRRSRYEYTTEISGDIKALARRFRVPVLVLAQLNRAPTDRRDPTPQLSDLRDSGAIEQDADGVILLHRVDYYTREGQAMQDPISDLQVIVAKNRHGPTGECSLAFDMAGSKMTTSRKNPASREREVVSAMSAAGRRAKRRVQEPKDKQMTWEDLTEKLDREFPFADKEEQHDTER